MFCGESLSKINAKGVELFRKGSAHEILSLESFNYFGTSK